MAPDFPRTPRTLAVVLALVVLALATRVPFLDADPARFKRVNELYDEGYWAHNARAAVLFGTRYPDDLAQAAASAPLFHWTAEAVFRIAGVSYASLRAISAAASVLLVPVVWALVAAGAGPRAALVAALLVVGNHELFALGRLGMPESFQLLLAVGGAAVWIVRRGPWDAAGAGALFALALLAKVNVVLVAGFAGVWMLEARQRRLAPREIVAFAAGFVPILAAWGILFYLPNLALFDLNVLALNREKLPQQWSDLVRLPLHFLNAGFWGLPSTYALGVLAALHLLAARQRLRAGVTALTPIETLALGWLGGLALPMALAVRTVDERRLLLAAVLLAMLAALNWSRRAPSVSDRRPPAGAVPRALALAAALAVVVVAVTFVFQAGHGARLWRWPWAALVVTGTIGLAALADRLRNRLGSRVFAAILVAAIALRPAWNLGGFVSWLVTGLDGDAPTLGASVTAVALAATVVVLGAGGAAAPRVVVAVYGVYAALGLGVNFVGPTFTLRDASRAVGAAAPPGAVIVGPMAHQLGLENRTHPVWYTPGRTFNRLLNPDLSRVDVRLVLTVTPPSPTFPNADDYPFPLTPVGRLAIYPAPYLAGAPPPPKVALTLYRRAD